MEDGQALEHAPSVDAQRLAAIRNREGVRVRRETIPMSGRANDSQRLEASFINILGIFELAGHLKDNVGMVLHCVNSVSLFGLEVFDRRGTSGGVLDPHPRTAARKILRERCQCELEPLFP